MDLPTRAGHWWYRLADTDTNDPNTIWCIRVEAGHWKAPLVGWVPRMDDVDPILPQYWDGTWLGEAIPPEKE
jgi:hypothetical protein